MRLKVVKALGCLAVTMTCVVSMSAASYGQSLPSQVEVTGHLGIVSGIGSHGSFGGSLGVPVSNKIMASADLSYIPLGGGSVTVLGSTTTSSARAFNFNGNLQYLFKPTHEVVPYAGAGLGFLRSSFSASGNLGPSFNASGSSTDLYFNVGGGFRYYVRERWGFRPEFMIFAGPNTYVRFGAGIFYKLGE